MATADHLAKLTKSKVEGADYGPVLKAAERVFHDRTVDYGLEGVEGVSFALVDLNRDSFPDLAVMPNFFSQPQFYLFEPKIKKFKLASYSPFPEIVAASYLLFADFNRDQVTDVVVGVLNQRGELTKVPVTLWRGRYGPEGLLKFQRDENFLKLPAEATSTIVTADFNLDGRLDLFLGNWFQEFKGSLIPQADRLLINTAKGWEDQTLWLLNEAEKSSSDLYPPHAKPTYGASTCDVDQDGWPDILTASSAGHYNKLWMNRSRPQNEQRFFEDKAREANYAADAQGVMVPTGGGRTFAAVCADYNNDGLMDVFLGELTHGWDNIAVDRSSILTGSKLTYPPSFLRTEYMSDSVQENWNQGDKRALWGDLNLDGLLDLVVDNSGFPPHSRLVVFAQDETHAFSNVASQWGVDLVNPTGTVLADFNQDGKLDILTGQTSIRHAAIKNRLYLLENHIPTQGRRAVVFHLEGKQSNDQGLGATVMLYTQKAKERTVQRRWYELAQGGIPSQSAAGIHFGLDAGASMSGVKVRWPTRWRGPAWQGKSVERLYPINDSLKESLQIFTLCEDGSSHKGRFRCQY